MNTIIYNAVNAKIQLQDEFTQTQLEQLRNDTTLAPTGYPTLYASEYRGMIYIENLTGVVLTTLPKKITKQMSKQIEDEANEAIYLEYFNDFLSTSRMAKYYEMEEEELITKIDMGRTINHARSEG